MNTMYFTRIICEFFLKILVVIFLSATQSTAYADVINGTPGNDYLVGTDGADKISGDILGGDLYYGDDVIYGGAGNDTLYGEYNGALNKVIDQGSNDVIYGGDGDDVLHGDGGFGSIYSHGRDKLFGEIGNDTLLGGGAGDELYGGEGNDYLRGGASDLNKDNEVYGEAGNDTIYNDVGNDILDGGEGYDILDHSWMSNDGGTVNLSTGIASGAGADTVRGIEEVWGSQMSDILIGSSANETLKGNGGNDVLEGGMGNDHLIGGLYSWGGDTASYEHASSSVIVNLNTGIANGGDGDDTLESIEGIVGSPYSDILIGNAVNNTLDGRSGDDTLEGYAGEDNLIGGPDNDALVGGSEMTGSKVLLAMIISTVEMVTMNCSEIHI